MSYVHLVVRQQDNKNMKIGIFTGGTGVGLKNIFTAISQYSTRKHEIKINRYSVHVSYTLTPYKRRNARLLQIESISNVYNKINMTKKFNFVLDM